MKKSYFIFMLMLLLMLVGCRETTTSSVTIATSTTNTTASISDTTSETIILDLLVQYQFSINSTLDLWIQIPQSGEIVSVQTSDVQYLVQDEDFLESENSVTILNEYLLDLPIGIHQFTIDSTVGSFEIEIKIIDSWDPYLMNRGTIYYEVGKDLILQFELFGGTIQALSGNDITAADYVIDGDQITIDIDYIHQKFVSTPERTTLIIAYTLSFNNDTEIGYLFIKP